jgi:hypothetical protein
MRPMQKAQVVSVTELTENYSEINELVTNREVACRVARG